MAHNKFSNWNMKSRFGRYIPKNDFMMTIKIGDSTKISINQDYFLNGMTNEQRRQFWSAVGKAIKRETKKVNNAKVINNAKVRKAGCQ